MLQILSIKRQTLLFINKCLHPRVERRLKVSENRALGRICGPERDEVTREWRKLHYMELNDLYSYHFIRMFKSRRVK